MADDSIRVKFNIDTANLPSQMQKIVNSIKKAEGEVERLRTKMDALKDQQIPSHEYKKLQAELDAAIKKYEELNDTVETFNRIGTDKKSPHYQRAIGEAQDLYMKIEEIRGAMFELEEGGKAFTLGGDSEEYARMAARVDELSGSIQVSKTRLAELNAKQKPVAKEFDNVKKKAEEAFSSVSKGAKRSGGLLTTLATRFRGIMLSLLIFNWITKAFNAMISGMKSGFENLMGYSAGFANSVQSLKNSMATLGNQFAAAFAPIVQMVIPWLRSLINALSTAMSYVAQFIALLGGKNTFTRAKQIQDSYNKSLGGTASAAKKAYGALAKFDDLDVLQKQEDTDAGGAGETLPQDMFEEVPIDPRLQKWLDGILERLKPILDYLKKLKDAFMDGFWDGLGDWSYRLDIIKEGLKQIMDALIDIWTDPAVLAAADRWAQSVMYMLGSLVGSVASIALTLAAAFIGGLGKYLSENTDRIKQFLISAFNVGAEINNLLAGLFQSIAYIFEGLASESGIRFVAALIGSILDAGMGIIEVALKLGRDFLEMFILPITENREGFRTAFEGLLAVGATVLETFKNSIDETFDKVNEIYDKHFKPFFDSVAKGLSEIIGKLLEFWNGSVQPVLQSMAEQFQTLWESYIQPFINNLVEVMGKVADMLNALWNNILVPLVGWLIENILPLLLPIIQTLWDNFLLFVEFLAEMANSIVEIFGGIIDFLTGVFSGDWSLAFDGLKEIVQGFSDFNQSIWNFIRSCLERVWSVIKDKATTIWTAIKTFMQTTWENVKTFAQNTWNNIKTFLINAWTAIKEKAISIWEAIRRGFEEKINAVRDKMEEIKEKFDSFREKVFSVFENIKETVVSAIDAVKGAISGFIGLVESAISAIQSLISSASSIGGSIGSAISGFLGISAPPGIQIPVGYDITSEMANKFDIPHLASGSVIQGGRPFAAILGDQPRGQVNIEAPLATIEQAVENAMGRFTGGTGFGGTMRVVLNVSGTDLAQVMLNDFLSEMNRQGYDVSVLGVT